MPLTIYNTATREKALFKPIDPEHVRFYVCGPTVYDYAHIGNARPVVVFDVLARLLRRLYPKVTYVRNITDVEDKIIARAASEGESISTITTRTIAAFHEDMAALGALEPDAEPRATQYISEMIAIIETLIAKDHAYEGEGHVLFHTPSMADYGAFARKNRDELVIGARVEVAPYKKDAADFVLWKPSFGDTPGWDSPWGFGRPGWHIECSAMSKAHLGITFDIHGGGVDLVFPHHQNEIAQSQCAHDGAALANYWMHNGYLTVDGEKMSKSLGNFLTVHDLRQEFSGEAMRLKLLSAHYRQPLDFSRSGIRDAHNTLDRWYRALGGDAAGDIGDNVEAASELPHDVQIALEDDLNTPAAIAAMHSLADAALAGDDAAARDLKAAGDVMGLLGRSAQSWFQGDAQGEGQLAAEAIDALLAERCAARADKDFATSDRIRDELADQGVVLEDGPVGTTWRRAG